MDSILLKKTREKKWTDDNQKEAGSEAANSNICNSDPTFFDDKEQTGIVLCPAVPVYVPSGCSS
jgi:hypothetical protein